MEKLCESRSGTPLRIAFFTDSYAPTHDGVARVTESLAVELARRGHALTVHTVRLPGLPRREMTAEGIEVVRHASVAAPSYPQYRIALFPYGPAAVLPAAGRFDVVHIHTPGFVGLGGWVAARRWRIPSVATYHTHLEGMLAHAARGRAGAAFFREWSRFAVALCWSCDLATAPSRAAAELLTRRRPMARRDRPALVIENGVDPGRFHPSAAVPDWRGRLRAGKLPMVTFLGRLTRDKGVGRFLDALDRWDPPNPFVGVIGGEGPLASEVRARLARNAGSRLPLRFIGPVEEEEKPALLAQSRVFVLPSLSDTSSVALLEAMASGAACVVSREGGPGEIALQSQACVAVEPRDPEAIRNAIGGLLGDPTATEELSRRGREWVVSSATVGRTAGLFLDAYRTVLAQRVVPEEDEERRRTRPESRVAASPSQGKNPTTSN